MRRLLFAHLLLSPLVLSRSTYEAFEFPKIALLTAVAIVCAAMGLAALGARRPSAWRGFGRSRLLHDPLRVGVCLFVLSAAISTIGSISPRTSWRGAPESDAGLVTVLAYAVLFFATRQAFDQEGFRRLLVAPAVAAAPVTAYALVQAAGLDPWAWTGVAEFGGVRRAASTMGHANFLAAFLVMVLPLLMYHGERAFRGGRRMLAAAAAATGALAIAVVLSSLSRAAWLALLVAATCLALGWPRGRRGWPLLARRLAVALAAVGIIVAAVVSLPAGGNLRTAVEARFSSLAAGHLGPRLEIWRGAVGMFREHPLAGVGLDCFQLAYQRHRSVAYWRLEGHHTPQKAHCEPLHVLATQGLLGVLALAVIAFGASRAAWRALAEERTDRKLHAAAIAALAAFVAQSLFSFTVAGIGTLATTLLALMSRLGEGGPERDSAALRAGSPADARFLQGCAAGLAGLALWVLVVQPLRASAASARAAAALGSAPAVARAAARQAVTIDPDRPRHWLQLGASAESLAKRAPLPARAGLFGEARNAVLKARDLVPADAYAHAMLGRVLTEMAMARPPLATAQDAENAFAEALARDPYNPFLVGRAAVAAAELEDFAREAALARRGEELDPGYGPFAWAEGYRHLARGMERRASDPAGAAAELEASLPLLTRAGSLDWLGDEAGRARAAHHLAVALYARQRYPEAAAAARRALEIDPSLVDARFNLGRISERLGNPEAARAEYRRVLAMEPMHQPARAALAAYGETAPPAGPPSR